MPEIHRDVIDHPAAWRGEDFTGKDDFTITMAESQVLCLEAAAEDNAGRDLEAITKSDFDLSAIAVDVAAWRDEVLKGRGLMVLRGFPVDRVSQETIERMYWGLGCHFGRAVSQSLMGDRIGHVVDVSDDHPGERGYRSRRELSFHTDSDDMVGMLCLHQAKSGGESKLVSGLAVHNVLARTRPEALKPLYRGFRYHWRGEQAPGEPPITDYDLPVLSKRDGQVSVCYLRDFIQMAADDLDQTLSEEETAALDDFDALCEDPALKLEFRLASGEALFFNNLTCLHARNAFEDDPTARRHMLRLWLKAPGARPMVEPLQRYYGSDGLQKQEGKGTVYDREAKQISSGPAGASAP